MQIYTNPVYQGYFADPFVWQYQGVFYAIGTGAAEAKGTVDEGQICLDKLIWTPEGPRCQGPTWTPQTINSSSNY